MASPQSIWGVRTEAVSVVIDREALRGANPPDAVLEVWYEGEKGKGKGKGKGKDGKGWTQNAETQTTTTSTATTERGVQTDPWTWAACLTQ